MFNYKPTATGLALHNSAKYLKLLCGPYGSGKSCACAMDIFLTAAAQSPASDGVRYSRVGVVRSSYPELQSATRRSLLEILPSECGTIQSTGSPMRGLYNIPLPDGTRIQLELELWAIQTEDDTEKLKSANWSFCWINEATGCAAAVYTAVLSRIGRFPPADFGGVTWGGVLMDFNRPVIGSWLDEFITNPQDNWDVFWQPPAAFKKEDEAGNTVYEINPDAENLTNLGSDEPDDPPDYSPIMRGMRFYRNQIEALLKTGREDIVQNQYCLLAVAIQDGKPVYPSFDKARHVLKQTPEVQPNSDIVLGLDQSGIHPAAVVLQESKGRWIIMDELYMEGEGFEAFLYAGLLPLLRRKYSNCPVHCVIDPSDTSDSWQAVAPSQRLLDVGIKVVPNKISNVPKVRIQAVEHMLNLHTGGLVVSPDCEMLIRGFESEYRYRRLRAAGSVGAVYTPQPEKNEYSHCHDALGYACIYILQGTDSEGREDFLKLSDAIKRQRRKLMRVV